MLAEPPAFDVGLPLPEQQAPAGPIDEELLALAVEVVEEWLTERRATIPPARKAQAVAALYEIGLEAEGKLEPHQVRRILRLVA